MCEDISRTGGADLCGCEVASVGPSTQVDGKEPEATLGGRGEETTVIEAGEGSGAKSVCAKVGLDGLAGCEARRRGFGDM